MTEYEMAEKCKKIFEKQGKYKHVLLEVPVLTRSMGMVMTDNEGIITGVEFKNKNWRKAAEQARGNKLRVDKSFICLPKQLIDGHVIEAVKGEKTGLLSYNEAKNSVEEVLPCEDGYKRNISVYRNMLVDSMEKIINGERTAS